MTIAREALHRLFDVIGESPDSLAELIESFLEEAPVLLDQMQRAADSSDRVVLGRAAHTLKSSARDFGAEQLSALCELLEKSCREGLPDQAAADVAVIVAAYAPVRHELGGYLAELKRGEWAR